MPLLVVATPIGHLDDLSPRAAEALASAEIVLCEDTRRTRALLAARGIAAPRLLSCHAHNEERRVPEVLAALRRGAVVALVSDAGTPGISDPGARVVRATHEAGLPVRAVPGPSSVAAALSVSGLPASPHHFLGFPPRAAGRRRTWLRRALALPGTLMFFEAGRRVGALLRDLAELAPDRPACLCRELTKLHEELEFGRVADLAPGPRRGEVVLVVGPAAPGGAPAAASPAGGDAEPGDLKAAARILAPRWGVSRSEAYRRLLALERGEE